MRRRTSRAAVTAGALALATTATTTAPADADVDVAKKRLHARAGQRVAVIGAVRPGAAGLHASLQVRHGGRWRTIDRDRTAASGRYVLRSRVRRPMSAPARVLARRPVSLPSAAVPPTSIPTRRERQRLGRLNVYRWAYASWYGPGLYGNPLGCGGTLSAGRLGVAHRSLPCGSKLTLRHRGRTVRVRVIDRGPYVGGREYDLTEATAQRLRFHGHGAILTTR